MQVHVHMVTVHSRQNLRTNLRACISLSVQFDLGLCFSLMNIKGVFMTPIKIKELSLVSLLCLSTQVFAAAPNIQGSVNINVEVGNVVNYAEATDSVAQIAIGSMSEGDAGGFDATVVVGDVVNYATGMGSCSQILIGSVGVPSCVAGSAAE